MIPLEFKITLIIYVLPFSISVIWQYTVPGFLTYELDEGWFHLCICRWLPQARLSKSITASSLRRSRYVCFLIELSMFSASNYFCYFYKN